MFRGVIRARFVVFWVTRRRLRDTHPFLTRVCMNASHTIEEESLNVALLLVLLRGGGNSASSSVLYGHEELFCSMCKYRGQGGVPATSTMNTAVVCC